MNYSNTRVFRCTLILSGLFVALVNSGHAQTAAPSSTGCEAQQTYQGKDCFLTIDRLLVLGSTVNNYECVALFDETVTARVRAVECMPGGVIRVTVVLADRRTGFFEVGSMQNLEKHLRLPRSGGTAQIR